MAKNHFWLRYYSTGDDDRPEIIELSELNQEDSPFAFCPPPKTREQEYRGQHYQEFTSNDYPSEEYPVGEYRQGYSNEYGHEHDYHQLQFPESEGEGGNDSVSEVNLSDGNIPKMKLEEVRDFHLMIFHMCARLILKVSFVNDIKTVPSAPCYRYGISHQYSPIN